VTDAVPSQTMKDGIMQYQCQALPDGSLDTVSCPGTSVTGVSGNSYPIQPGFNALSPAQIKNMDPLHVGPSPIMLAYLNTWPNPNCNNAGDGVNYT
jgi:hypothetical protein